MKVLLLFLPLMLSAQKAEVLDYGQTQFDSAGCCWRALAAEHKYAESAQLIVYYLKTGKVTNRQSLHWHAGQMFAFAKNDTAALEHLGKTHNVFQRWFGGDGGKTWYYFARGTIAFLKRDKNRLEKIVAHWGKKLPQDNNYSELEKLLANWELDYRTATLGSSPGG